MSEATERIWYEYSIANAENPAQIHRWRLVRREVAALVHAPSVIIDLGCGSGALLRRLGTVPGSKLIGIDVEPRALEIARKRLPGAEFHIGNLDDRTASNFEALAGRADIVVCSEVLEHLAHPEVAVALAARLLRDRGSFVVTVPAGPMNEFDRSIGHQVHYSIRRLTELLEANGFRVRRCYRWGFPFHTLYRMGIGAVPGVVDGFSDSNITATKRAVFRILTALFFFNVRSRWAGRQLVAVAIRSQTK